MQRLADVVEAVGRTVGRQQLLQLDLDAEQVADRVLVLDAVEPAQHDPPFLFAAGEFGLHPLRFDPAGQHARFCGGRPRVRIGRHLAEFHALADPLPLARPPDRRTPSAN